MPKKKSIVLLSPPTVTYRTPEENLGLEYLAAESMVNGYLVYYIDAFVYNISVLEVIDNIFKINPDVLGIAPSMDSIKLSQEIISGLREKGFRGKVVMGGVYASFEADKLFLTSLCSPDGILTGEADLTFQEFLEKGTFRGLAGAIYLEKGKIIQCVQNLR